MAISVGIDCVEIARVARSMERESFLERYFSATEREYFASKNMAAQTVAGHFCAKEAFSKALGSGIRGFALDEVSVEHDAQGCPYLAFSGMAAELAAGRDFAVSITHTRTQASAVVVASDAGVAQL